MAKRCQMRPLRMAWRVHELMPLLITRHGSSGYRAAVEQVSDEFGIDERNVRRAYQRWRHGCKRVDHANEVTGHNADLCNGVILFHVAISELGYAPELDDEEFLIRMCQ